ncbi:MAG: branched-chain amino acid ABC transporter permease [Ilumatobacteraceae bacterium]
MTFHNFIDVFWPSTVNGIVLGSVYALIALGYTLVYGVLRLINFAHADIFMLATFGSFIAIGMMGIGTGTQYKTGLVLVFALVLCMVMSVAIGGASAVALEFVAYRPLRRRNAPRLVFLISAIGASFAISEAVGEWGPKQRDEYRVTKLLRTERLFNIFSARVTNVYVIVVVAALAMMLVLYLFVNRTRVGRGIRAVAQDSDTARLMGVNVNRVIVITFLVGGLMAGGAAFLYEIYNGTTRSTLGFLLGIKAFTAAVLGGIGNIRGALLGGLLLGVIEQYGASLFGSDQNMGNVTAFVVLVLVLLVRPTGLLGESLGRSRA